jgi:hypothetical protein
MRENETPTPPESLGNGEPEVVGAVDEDSIARARVTLAEAEAWRRENSNLYKLLESWALDEAEAGHKFSSRELVERLRWHGMSLTDSRGRSVKVSNGMAAVLARWLVAEHPECRELLTLRRSPLDEVMGV